jgi:hypothetical protein
LYHLEEQPNTVTLAVSSEDQVLLLFQQRLDLSSHGSIYDISSFELQMDTLNRHSYMATNGNRSKNEHQLTH